MWIHERLVPQSSDTVDGLHHLYGHLRYCCLRLAVAIFATGIALSSLLIAAYSQPFTGAISVRPELPQQVIPSETATTQPNGR
jgi:hypothetical protein